MTQTEKAKIMEIIRYCKENKPASIKPLVNQIISSKVSQIIAQKRDQISSNL